MLDLPSHIDDYTSMPLLATTPRSRMIGRRPMLLLLVGTSRRDVVPSPLPSLIRLQEESKAQKKKNSTMKKELQETSEGLLMLLEELRK